MAQYESVHSSVDSLATVNEVMNMLAKLPYLAMIEFAALIEADADRIAGAVEAYFEGQSDD